MTAISRMTSDGMPRGDRESHVLVMRLFRWHLLAYCLLIGALTVVNIFVGGGWWSFWPMCAWGLVLALHFFYYKSVTVDEAWAQERTDDLRLRSYDLSHISDIEDRVDSGDSSVSPPSERDG
jgi:hypothetical protein